MKRNRKSKRRGAILALVALLMVPLFAMLAFAVDYGYLLKVRTDLQRTADAAALAAVQEAGVIVTYPDKRPFMEAVEEMKAAYDGTEVGRFLRAIEAVE